jgi:lysophospholipase L1-like esterase
MCLTLVSNERDVVFKSLAAPGNALGITDSTGFNSDELLDTFARIGGTYAAWDYIMVMAGVNDYNRNVPWEDTVDSLRRIMNYALSFGRKVIVFDPIWKAGEGTANPLGNTLNTYRFFLLSVCNEFPSTAYFAHRANTIMGDSAGAAYYDATEVATSTQLHPNVSGHRFLAEWVKSEAATAGLF